MAAERLSPRASSLCAGQHSGLSSLGCEWRRVVDDAGGIRIFGDEDAAAVELYLLHGRESAVDHPQEHRQEKHCL